MIRLALSVGAMLLATPALASDFDRLMRAMLIDDVVDILVEEGSETALSLEQSMFPGRGGAAWEAEVARIYDEERRSAQVRAAMEARLSEGVLPLLADFMESERGQRIMSLEVTARRAFIDPGMEEVAREVFADVETDRPDFYAQIQDFIGVNDLIGQNVEGSFRSNYAFALGAHSVGAFPGVRPEELAAQMWAGEDAVTANVTGWMEAYLMTAYSPLEDGDLEVYIALSKSEAGEALNAAIMGGFADLFDDISFDLGAAAGRFIAQQDI